MGKYLIHYKERSIKDLTPLCARKEVIRKGITDCPNAQFISCVPLLEKLDYVKHPLAIFLRKINPSEF